METLSAYARQFLDRMERPDVDSIEGLSPAISIEQKTTGRSPRSTVGTITEIYDYLRLLYASIGVPHCPNCGRPISRQSADQIVNRVMELAPGERVTIYAPIVRGRKGEFRDELEKLDQQGFRARIDGEVRDLAEDIVLEKRKNHTIEAIVDRIAVKPGVEKRLETAVTKALQMANGLVLVAMPGSSPDPVRFGRSRRRTALFLLHGLSGLPASMFPNSSRAVFPSTAPTARAPTATASAAFMTLTPPR